MKFHNTAETYGLVTRILHWLIAVQMIALIALGWWMVDLSYYSAWYTTAPWLHKAFGLSVFAMGVVLLIWRMRSVHPEHVDGHKPYEKLASHIAKWLMLICLIAIPVSGYIFTTATGEGVDFFGLFTLISLFPVSDAVRDWAISIHYYASYGLIGVIVAHGGGALKHHFIDRDRTLRRMIKD